ncbi:hypothetical protein AVEN_2586-1 [Araneus ventricosus]|uniref:Uncharacterized protein n=1 Tax=Araneus ventricosus TaxID=182803 RepID=A0A4Y2SFZ5_ARAVE|nr:hypothetical protein AVEN_90841-1 [Araneus ventricosus]GBN93144.1 hypothetical protein AVEN_258082-1 [Araneus ventricosus]GBN93146.1 hypothetical protein AVEN_2586-1 [Araneus ventricosus]
MPCEQQSEYKRNCRIWGSENPQSVQEVERNCPKINVWCDLPHDTVIGPFFFAEASVTANIYLDMLQIYAIPQLLSSNKLLGHGCSSTLMEQDYRLDILGDTKGAHVEVH